MLLPLASNNHNLLAKFHSGTFKITWDTMRLMPLFHFYELLLEHLLEFLLNRMNFKNFYSYKATEMTNFQTAAKNITKYK